MFRFSLRGLVQEIVECGLFCTRDFAYPDLFRNQMPVIYYNPLHGHSINGGDVMISSSRGHPFCCVRVLPDGPSSHKFAWTSGRQGFFSIH